MHLRRAARAVLLVFGSVLLLLTILYAALTPDCRDEGCPTLGTLEAYTPPEPPRVYDRGGRLVGQLAGPRRILVSLEEVPPLVREGFVAVEDRRFREHGGVDPVGILRAAVRNVSAGSVREGASTITMQLVRNVFGPDVLEYGKWRRKLTEARMALAVEQRLPKDRILELYLNQIYLGGGVYGVETAARHFFGKGVADVTPSEAALLVGLAKNPEGYNPRRHPRRALSRRSVILGVFVREGLLSKDEAVDARGEALDLAPADPPDPERAWYFAAVARELRARIPDPRERRGLRIHTGYDRALQSAAAQALAERIAAVESDRHGPFEGPVPAEDGPSGFEEGTSPYLQGMVVALDARTGAVRALVGGRDFSHSEFDRAFQARRQPGSAFKPFVVATALEQRRLTLLDRIETTPVVVRQAGSEPWRPRDEQADGEPLTVREALVRSSNTAAVRVGRTVGIDAVVRRARGLGLDSPLPRVPSLFLGTADVRPVSLVAAYAAFGNGGRRVTPHVVTRIEDRQGNVVGPEDPPAPEPVMDAGAAYLVLDVLRDVVDEGTGWRVRQAGYAGPAAGKTGTTDENRDAWFVGLTPDVAAGVWLGFDEPRPIVSGAGGGSLAAPTWGRMMALASDALEKDGRWRRPVTVVEVPVDTRTGHRAADHCPEEIVRTELFLFGTDPALRCPVHKGGFLDRVWDRIKGAVSPDEGG